MNAKKHEISSMNRSGAGAWLTGSALIVTAALAILVAVIYAPKPAAAQSVPGHIQMDEAVGCGAAQSVPDANTKSVLDYLEAHSLAPAERAQSVPDEYAEAVMLYLRAFGLGPGVSSEQP